MAVSEIDKYISSIEGKVAQLITDNRILKGKVGIVEQYNQQLSKELEESREIIKNLENQIKILNIAKGNSEGGVNVKEMREQINEVIREIDKSIRYLKG